MTFSAFGSSLSRHADKLSVLGLLLIQFTVYAPFLLGTGFYWDDWPVVSIYSLFGSSGLHTYFTGNRPLVGWLFAHLFPLLGTGPFGWHLAVLAVVSLTAIILFLTFRALWPPRPDVAWVVTALVLLYPGFSQQSIALTYLPHYLSLLLFVMSLRLTLYALGSPRFAVPLVGIAILLGLASYSLTEYFIGLELFRILVIWHRTRETSNSWRSIAPYGITWLGFLVWRSFFYQSADNASYKDVSSGLHQIAQSPLRGIIDRLGVGIHNLFVAAVFAWSRPFSTQLLDGSRKSLLVAWGLAAIVLMVTITVLRLFKKKAETGSLESASGGTILAVGGLFASGIPLLASGLRADFGTFPSYADRFALPFILASPLLLALLLLRIRRLGVALVSGLLCVFAVFQIQSEIQYRRDWNLQRTIFWQARWRAPMLTPGTSVYVDGLPKSIFHNDNAGMLDLLYSTNSSPETLNYFIFDLNQPNFKTGKISSGSVRSYKFHGLKSNSVVWWISPGGTLYMIDGSNGNEPRHSGSCADLASFSAPARMIQGTPRESYALLKILGPEPKHDWVFYYQRAELERQLGRWDEVARLGDEAIRQHYQPSEGSEWLPFIEGYARTGRYDMAEHLTELAVNEAPQLEKPVTTLWRDVMAQASTSPPIRVMQALEERLD